MCIAISVFDDDVLTLSVIKAGKVLTRHVSGDTDTYDMKSVLGDVVLIADAFGIPQKTEDLKTILENENIWKKFEELEKLTHMILYNPSQDDDKEMDWKEINTNPAGKKKPDFNILMEKFKNMKQQ